MLSEHIYCALFLPMVCFQCLDVVTTGDGRGDLVVFGPEEVHLNSSSEWMGAEKTNEQRIPRFYFPLFKVVQFKNEVCITTDLLTGTCYTRTECEILGGRNAGSCARGFGVCCFWDVTCGEIAIRNRSYFLSPEWRRPFNAERRCELIVKKPRVATGVCLLRLNFRRFELAPPHQGRCSTDAFQVPHSSKLPVLCGNNTGHHMYIDFAVPKELRLIVKTTTKNYPRRWAMELLYIECTSPSLAPSGCLQYYTGGSGRISTFNAACAPPLKLSSPATSTVQSTAAGRRRRHVHQHKKKKNRPFYQLNQTLVIQDQCLIGGLDYSICVRVESDMCAIQWIAVVFDMGPDGLTTALRGDSCQPNYIGLAGGFSGSTGAKGPLSQGKTFDRFCGLFLNTEHGARTSVPITSLQKPYVARVRTGPSFVGPFRGASFNYVQRICV